VHSTLIFHFRKTARGKITSRYQSVCREAVHTAEILSYWNIIIGSVFDTVLMTIGTVNVILYVTPEQDPG